jgi:hypothetical protein
VKKKKAAKKKKNGGWRRHHAPGPKPVDPGKEETPYAGPRIFYKGKGSDRAT